MSFQAADFLAALYGERPTAPDPTPGSGAPAGIGPREPLAADADGQAPANPDFSDWVQRPDCKGRMGWERPDLPEAARWWARCEFDDLPGPPVSGHPREGFDPCHSTPLTAEAKKLL